MPTFGKFRLTRNDHINRHKRDPHLTMFLIVYFLNEKEAYLMMDSDNPVGVADEVYEFVQYRQSETNRTTNGCGLEVEYLESGNRDTTDADSEEKETREAIEAMKFRLAKCTREYLSRRATINMALIDRVLSEESPLDIYARKLLEHERSIYESYLDQG